MTGVTQILASIERGDPHAAEQLLPLVYEELRRLASAKLLQERRDHTFSATALVHEAYLRLVDVDREQTWNSRSHFFAAAAEAMRRILVENARQRSRGRNGNGRPREPLRDIPASNRLDADTVLVIDEAIARLAESEPDAANIVKLHIFGGLTLEETADSLDVSRATVYRHWAYARATLRLALRDEDGRQPSEKKPAGIPETFRGVPSHLLVVREALVTQTLSRARVAIATGSASNPPAAPRKTCLLPVQPHIPRPGAEYDEMNKP